MDIKLPFPVEKILRALNERGYEAFIVGGCVRDFLLGKTPLDYDITTPALPEQVRDALPFCRIIQTGIKHGTVTAVLNDMPVEITTYRIDGEYSDNRRPDHVTFTRSLREDLSRRDFTVNALAYSPCPGIIDYFGGINDIKNKIIRCVGGPDKRFGEDALRIMRALRFSSVLSFEIESLTAGSLIKNKNLLNNISVERINAELSKLTCGQNAYVVLKEFIDIIKVFIPELELKTELPPFKTPPVLHLRMAELLRRCGTPDNIRKILRRLKYDNDLISKVCILLENDIEIMPSLPEVKRRLNKMTEPLFRDLLLLNDKNADELSALADIIIEQGQCYRINGLALNGNDLITLGYEGKAISDKLKFLLDAVIDNKAENTREELTAFLSDSSLRSE